MAQPLISIQFEIFVVCPSFALFRKNGPKKAVLSSTWLRLEPVLTISFS